MQPDLSISHFVRKHFSFVVAVLFALTIPLVAQTTISTGSIQGFVIDPTGAVVSGAKVSIRSKGTNQTMVTTTNSSGTYASGALVPGDYELRIEASGFQTVQIPITVLVNTTSSGSVKLTVGQSAQVIEVQGSETAVNTDQATVQGIINTEQIENLPVNGRNFLDLAQLEPGIQMQDGGNFDPTKKGFSSISFGGRFGRTARIEVDGIDISDETVGTTTQDVPQGAIQEFQIGESMLDLSTELTSSGSVNVTTKSGTNVYHGQGYYYFRDQTLDANLPGGSHTPFQRNQFGGSFGGAIIKNKLFFFLDAERTKQDFLQPVIAGPPFQSLVGAYSAPFRETESIGRLDYNLTNNAKLFYRFSYDQNADVASFESIAFQPLNNGTRTRDHVVGADFTTGTFTHSVRFGYMKFFNHISSGTAGTTPFNPTSPIELAIGPDPLCLNTSGVIPDVFCSGQGFLAPQSTPQSDRQIKYDGSKAYRTHVFRYGFGFNHIQGGGFAGFLADGPAVNAGITDCGSTCLALPGGAANALNYPANTVILGNGQGFSTEKPSFGFPAGGLGPDNRISWYIGDSWKLKPNFTLTYGLRYVRDTGRTDSDLAPIPALNQFGAGLGNRVNNPNMNFAPQLGFAWDPNKTGKTVFRGGIGLFYENSIWNNVLFDRPARLTQGRFLQTLPACAGGAAQPLPFATSIDLNNVCGKPVGQVQAQLATLQSEFQAAAAGNGLGANPTFIGTFLQDTGPNGSGTNLFAPDYKTPRSVQMNVGIQHEFHRGTVFTADFLRNVSTHTLLAVDTNHVGDARYPNNPDGHYQVFLDAINKTITANVGSSGCAQATSAGASAQGAINCYLAHFNGFMNTPGGVVPDPNAGNIADFAANGLDSGYSFGGGPCPTCAFAGVSGSTPGSGQYLGGNQMLFPIGRSVYNGLQMSLKQDLRNPFKDVRYLNFQVSYALSKYVSQAQDGDFINSAWNYAKPGQYMGPDGLDRRHQLSFGGTVELPMSFRFSVISHFYSSLPQTLTLQTTGSPGGIFVTAVNGDGTGDGNTSNGSNGALGGILPGTNLGSFGRDVTPGNINKVISNYNQNFAGKPTPAGQALLSASLFTQAQLTALGAVMPTVNSAPTNQASDGWLRALDMSLNWTYKVKERLEIQPGASFFNALNFANFDAPKNTLSGVLSTLGTAPVLGSANGTPGRQPDSLRSGLGSGVFGVGSPRVLEFSLKFNF
jgi:hypothetical protein